MVKFERVKGDRPDIPGLGIQVPPLRSFVIIYFSQQGRPIEMADAFYERYNQISWKNKKGKLITNWKVHAWQWIWDGKI